MLEFKIDRDPDPPPELPAGERRRVLSLFEGRLALLIQIAGLLGTAWIVWLTTLSPRLHRFTWVSLISHALGYALFAWAWSAAITFVLYLAVPERERGDMANATLRTSAAAVWFAPAMILFTQL